MANPWVWISYLYSNPLAKQNFLEFLDFLSTQKNDKFLKVFAENRDKALGYQGQLELLNEIRRRFTASEKEEQSYEAFQQRTGQTGQK